MTIKLSVWARKKLKAKKYVSCLTSFYTNEGPAAGTIWWDESQPMMQPRTVSRIYNQRKVNRVEFTDLTSILLSDFKKHVELGFFVMIGVTPEPWSHTEI